MKECFGPEVSYGETETGKTDKGRQKGQTQKKKGQTQEKKQRQTIKNADEHGNFVKFILYGVTLKECFGPEVRYGEPEDGYFV